MTREESDGIHARLARIETRLQEVADNVLKAGARFESLSKSVNGLEKDVWGDNGDPGMKLVLDRLVQRGELVRHLISAAIGLLGALGGILGSLLMR